MSKDLKEAWYLVREADKGFGETGECSREKWTKAKDSQRKDTQKVHRLVGSQ